MGMPQGLMTETHRGPGFLPTVWFIFSKHRYSGQGHGGPCSCRTQYPTGFDVRSLRDQGSALIVADWVQCLTEYIMTCARFYEIS